MMKQRRRVLASLSLAFVLLFASCGGRQSVASRSAAAYDEARRKGTPVEGGHEHGGHADDAEAHANDPQTPATDHSATHDGTGMDHSTMPSDRAPAMDHSTTHNATSGVQHAKPHAGMAGKDHSKMQGGSMLAMDHPKKQSGSSPADHSKMQSGSMPAMDHSKMQSAATPAMDHSASHDSTMPGMQHGASTPAAHSSTTTDLARIDPTATLSPDSFDAPSRVSVAEAVKAANNVPDGEIRHIVPGQDRENPPTPQPAFRGQAPSATDHSAHGAPAPAAQTEAAIYACPMHPDVTSDRPGSCPKCAMTLVKKK